MRLIPIDPSIQDTQLNIPRHSSNMENWRTYTMKIELAGELSTNILRSMGQRTRKIRVVVSEDRSRLRLCLRTQAVAGGEQK